MVSQRRKALAWIMAHRLTRKTCWALAKLENTPAFVSQQWSKASRNGNIPGAILQTAAAITIGGLFGGMYGLYF